MVVFSYLKAANIFDFSAATELVSTQVSTEHLLSSFYFYFSIQSSDKDRSLTSDLLQSIFQFT